MRRPIKSMHTPRKGEYQYLCLPALRDVQLGGVGDLYGVACAQRAPIGVQCAACDVNVDPAARPDGQGRALSAVEQPRVNPRVLMDQHRSVGAIGRYDEAQSAALLFGSKAFLFVA